MAIRYYVSTEEASFFNNNRMGYANSIPTEGNYKVGDFIISSTQEDGVFGWVCTVAGNPGEWEVIGSGMNNGSSNDEPDTKIVGYVNAVSFDDARSSVEIGINEYKKSKDFLEVHYNGLLLAEGIHYNVSADGKSIEAIDDVWNENADDTQQMIFRVLKSEGINVSELKNTVNIDSACYEVEMGIEGFNPEKDVVEVHLNGVLLVQGVDYEIVEGRINKLDRSEAWNPYNVNGQKMFVKVFRNNANLVEPAEGSVTMDKLADDVKEDLAAIDGLVATVGMQNNTIANLNDRVAAIEEKIESGDIVTNGGGGGGPVKLTYKDNLVEVINTNTVAIGLPFNKQRDILEVHIDGLKLAEGVHYNISEDGTRIVKVEGVWNPDSLDDQYIDFRVISAGNEQIEHLTRNVEFSSPMTEVGIELEYEHGVDILIVHLNGIKLVEGLDFEYVAEGNKIVKIDTSEPWNLYGVDGQLFVIDVLRNVGEKVTMDGLADDVKQAIEAASNIDLSGYVEQNDYDAKIAELEGKVNEAFTNANNGKQLIANAIGEPVSADDTFSAMSNDINSLLSTFKTNMMNNGIVVESNDKFKSLIDKIATLVDSEGKGIRYAEINLGAITLPKYDGYTLGKRAITINYNERGIDFIPSIVFVHYGTIGIMGSNFNKTFTNVYNLSATIDEINNEGFVLNAQNTYEYEQNIGDVIIYLIGVGEEDTTLRDSLASILEEEGVSVSEEDDMASLITKVDEEFNDKNNKINDSIARFPIPSWTGITLNGQLLTSDFATRLGEFTHNIQIGNSIHFIKFQGSSSNWKVLNIDTGVIEDWSAYINTSITTIQINEDNGYIYAMLEKKAFKFDISSKSWSQITINKTITSSSDVNSWLGSICVNNIIYTMYLTKRYEHVAFNKYDLTNGTEEFVTTGSNIYGGKIMKYGNKILWQAKTNGAVKSNNTLIFNPSDNTTTVAGALRLDGSDDYIYGLYDNCYFIEGDLLYYAGKYNGVKCMCIKNLTTDYDDYDVKMENTEKIGNASFICKLNNHVILSDLGFFII